MIQTDDLTEVQLDWMIGVLEDAEGTSDNEEMQKLISLLNDMGEGIMNRKEQ